MRPGPGALRNELVLIALAGGLLSGCAVPETVERTSGRGDTTGPTGAQIHEHAVGVNSHSPADTACAAARHQSWIGRPIDEIDTAALPGPLRVYTAGSRISADHRPDRMNIVIGTDGKVIKVTCG